jgi:biopolymer transport protein ExbD
MAIQRSSEKAFPEEEPEFQVAPMIDVLLVLMTFFMSITSTDILRTKTKIHFDLPVAKEGKAKEGAPSEVVVNVGWDKETKTGKLEFEEKTLNDPSEITDVINKRKVGKPFFRAVVRAGDDVPYSYVQTIMSACAAADVDNITFAVVSNDNNKKKYERQEKNP